MIKLYSPRNEGEAALLKSILDSACIPYFVHNDLFGSMRVGPQIDLLNMKTIMVPEEYREQARELIVDYVQTTVPEQRPTPLRDRLRAVIEVLLFGWFVPGRMRRRRADDPSTDEEMPPV